MRGLPAHWALSGPDRPQPAGRLFRWANVRGGHADTVRRVLRVGPFALYAVRYRPGHVEERRLP